MKASFCQHQALCLHAYINLGLQLIQTSNLQSQQPLSINSPAHVQSANKLATRDCAAVSLSLQLPTCTCTCTCSNTGPSTAVMRSWSRYAAALMHVRSTGHYILQLEHIHRPGPAQPQLLETQEVPAQMLQLGPPLFKLAGLAIGNGLTDPKLQVMLLPLLLPDVACAAAASIAAAHVQ